MITYMLPLVLIEAAQSGIGGKNAIFKNKMEVIDINKLHSAHFTDAPGSGQTTYKLDSLIRVIQLREFKNLVYQTTTQQWADRAAIEFIRHLINAKIEYQYYPHDKMFSIRDGEHTARVWFKSTRSNDRLQGFANCFIVEDEIK